MVITKDVDTIEVMEEEEIIMAGTVVSLVVVVIEGREVTITEMAGIMTTVVGVEATDAAKARHLQGHDTIGMMKMNTIEGLYLEIEGTLIPHHLMIQIGKRYIDYGLPTSLSVYKCRK